jgi:hypothetical protein
MERQPNSDHAGFRTGCGRNFLQTYSHLPDIPSETEVKEKGVSLADMQAKLLAKVEELTLHAIQQEKENRELRERIARMENRDSGSGEPAVGR